MKKIIAFILTICMCALPLCILSSCDESEHVHSYSSEWSKDESNHWHVCEGENCIEASDKAAHTWDEGTVTTEPGADTDGTRTFTCTVCGQTKTETITPEGDKVDSGTGDNKNDEVGGEVNDEEWNLAIAEHKFDNVTMNYIVDGSDGTFKYVAKAADGKFYRYFAMLGEDGTETDTADFVFTGEEAEGQKAIFMQIFLALLAEKDNFVYDSEQGIYIAPEKVTATIPYGEDDRHAVEEMTNGKVKFNSEGLIEYFSHHITESIYAGEELVYSLSGEVVWTLSDYGTTVIE